MNKGKATGIIQWMLNSAWPSMYWQLYDYYLRPTGAYYGAKKACEPLHLLYHYGENAVYLINDYNQDFYNYTARIQMINIDSRVVYSKEMALVILRESSTALLDLPDIHDLSITYFLDLRLVNNQDKEIGNNFYWLSAEPDVLDYDYKFKDFTFYTPTKKFADLSLINSLQKVKLKTAYRFEHNDESSTVQVDLENPSDTLAFFIELAVYKKKTREMAIPVFWEDNYISLLPREKRRIRGIINIKALKDDSPELAINGWNV